MRDGAIFCRLLSVLLCLSAACAFDDQRQDDWAAPMDAYSQRQLAARSMHRPSAMRHAQRLQGAARRLLTPSRQSKLTASGSGVLLYQPTGYTIDGGDLTQFFLEAHANGNATGIKLSAGTYHVNAKAEDGYHLHFWCSNDRFTPFEIDLTGTFFYFADHRFSGVHLEGCSNVDLHGPYEQTYITQELDFTQGTILAVDTKNMMITVQVDDSYPSDRVMMQELIAPIAFTADTKLVKNQPCPDIAIEVTIGNTRKLSYNKYQFPYVNNTCSLAGAFGPRDLFVARGNSSTKGVVVTSCNTTIVRDLTIYNSGGFAIFQDMGTNNTFSGIQVRPFPRPLGNDGKLPLLSVNADSFHSVNAHRGTILRNNFFVNGGDDGIAMHGEYYLVASTNPSKQTVVIASGAGFPFGVNDTLTFYAPDTQSRGSGIIENLYSVSQPSSTQGKISHSISATDNFAFDDLDYMEVKFQYWHNSFNKIQYDDVVASPSANGNGFEVVNNTIGNLRGRACMIKSSNGVIADNTFFNLMYFAIELAPEHSWQESDFVHNILVTNNLINSNGTGIWLGIDPWKWGVPPMYTNNYAVDFVGNTIVNVQSSPFTVTSSAQVSIVNTTFVNVLCAGGKTEFFDWASPGSIIFLANVADVTFSGNAVHNNDKCRIPSGNYSQPVSMVNATNIQGLQPQPQAPTATLLQKDEGSP